MSKRIFTQEQISELAKNPGVLRCSEKSITYHKDFKLTAIKRYDEGLPPAAIFAAAGFNLNLIGRKAPKDCLHRWLAIYRQKGETAFVQENRGGPGRRISKKRMTDQEKLKYYQTQIAYLKAENAFLAKLRKQR